MMNDIERSKKIPIHNDVSGFFEIYLENYYLVTTNLVTSVWLPETILTM